MRCVGLSSKLLKRAFSSSYSNNIIITQMLKFLREDLKRNVILNALHKACLGFCLRLQWMQPYLFVSLCFLLVCLCRSQDTVTSSSPPPFVSLRILSQGRRMKLAGTTRKKRWNLRRLWLRIPSGVAMRSINAAHAQSSPGTAGTRITRIAKKTLKVGAGDPRNQTSPR